MKNNKITGARTGPAAHSEVKQTNTVLQIAKLENIKQI